MGWDGMGWAVNRKICTASGIDISVMLCWLFILRLIWFYLNVDTMKEAQIPSHFTFTWIELDFEYKGPRRFSQFFFIIFFFFIFSFFYFLIGSI